MKKILMVLMISPIFVLYSAGIVSLAPNITEIIYALDAQDKLIGRTSECNYPDSCLSVESVGDPWKPNIEKIIMLKPDLVIASSLTDSESVKSIKKAGINIYRISYENSLEGIYKTIEEIGCLIGKNKESHDLNAKIKNEIRDIENKVKGISLQKKAIYLMSWSDGMYYAATGDTFIDGILKTAGLINIAENAEFWVVGNELLFKENPDIIFIPRYANSIPDVKQLKKTKPFKNLKAEIVIIDGDALERQGARTPEITDSIAQAAYPELFK